MLLSSTCEQVSLSSRFGVSDALYEEFLKPLLLVGLFELPEHLSAAAMIGTLYFYSAHPIHAPRFHPRHGVLERHLP